MPTSQPTRKSTVVLISTRHPWPHWEPKHWYTMIQHLKHPGRHLQRPASTLDPPPTTTNASDSTFQQRTISASLTPDACIQPTFKSQLLCNMTSPLQRQQTSSRYLGVLCQHWLLQKSSTSEPSNNSPLSWTGNKRPHQQSMHQL